MRFFTLLIVGLALGRSTSTLAQAPTVKPADLIGQWARQGEKEPGLTFRADSTFTLFGVVSAGPPDGAPQLLDAVGRWRLLGDTLLIVEPEVKLDNSIVAGAAAQVFGNDFKRLVKLNGRLLTMTTRDAGRSYQYERLDTSKSCIPKPCITRIFLNNMNRDTTH